MEITNSTNDDYVFNRDASIMLKDVFDRYKDLDTRTQIFSDFMFPVFMDLLDMCEDYQKQGNTDRLKVVTDQYNSYSQAQSQVIMGRFIKYGQCYIRMTPIGNGMTFQNTRLNGEYLMGDCNYNKTLLEFCNKRGVHLTNDHNAIIIHADESIIREHKLNQILK